MSSGKVTVCVLGWWRSSPKAVSKYCDLYKAHSGVKNVVTDTMSSMELTFPGQRNLAVLRTLELINEGTKPEEEGKPSRPLVIHAMSNNGGLQLASVLNHLKASGNDIEQPDIRGIIIDSAPGDLTMATWTRALLASVPNPTTFGLALGTSALGTAGTLAAVLGPTLSLGALGLGVASTLFLDRYVTQNYHARVVYTMSGYPKLFLYSDGDDLVNYKTVEAVAGQMKAKGDDITMHRFDKTPHVSHMRSDKYTYEKLVYGFLDKIVSNLQK